MVVTWVCGNQIQPPCCSKEDAIVLKFNAPARGYMTAGRKTFPKAVFVSVRHHGDCSRKQPWNDASVIHLKVEHNFRLDRAFQMIVSRLRCLRRWRTAAFPRLMNLNLNIFKVNVRSVLQMWRRCRNKTLPLQRRPEINFHFQLKVSFFWKTVVMDVVS